MSTDAPRADAELFARLRTLWMEVDPAPAELVDRMVAAVAADDLSREYALLTLVDGANAPVRGEGDAMTLQFSDGTLSILLHVTEAASGRRRVDGWVDAGATEIRLLQGDRSWTTEPGEHGRFAFDDIPPGIARVSLTAETTGGTRIFATPQFEV